jgi:TRAP-type C4-dicarboxylate transport system substrate-binding protein
LGTVDIIISGPSFAARTYPRFGIAYYPFIFRDGDHLIAYSKSPVFQEMVNEFRAKTGIQVTAYTYYGARHTTAQKPIPNCAAMKGLKIRVPDVPAYRATPEACGANHAHCFCRGVPGPAKRHRGSPRKPFDHHRSQKVL